jgi:hypothetical protein
MGAAKELMDFAHAQRPMSPEPLGDAIVMVIHGRPLVGALGQRTRLDPQRDLVNLGVRELTSGPQSAALGSLDLTTNGFAVDPALADNAVKALFRRPAAKHFFDVDRRQVPVGHGLLPDGDPRRRRGNPRSLP